jgi:protein TonB
MDSGLRGNDDVGSCGLFVRPTVAAAPGTQRLPVTSNLPGFSPPNPNRMSLAVHAADLFDDALRARRRDERLLLCTLAASVLVHTAVVVLAPGFRKLESEAPRPLEVRIVTPPAPAPMRPDPPPQAKPSPPLARAPARTAEPRLKPATVPAPAPKAVLALPETAPTAVPAFTMPQAAPEPPPAEPKAVAAAPAPAPPAPAREVPITPPVHDAAYLNNPKPRYPMVASKRGIEGTVHVRVHVSRDGRPLQVALDRTSGSPLLDNAALDAVRGWRFVPARRGQEAVEQAVTVPIVFKLDSAT